MKLAVALGLVFVFVWVLGALLIGSSSPSHLGLGIAESMIIGMAFGAVISVVFKRLRTR